MIYPKENHLYFAKNVFPQLHAIVLTGGYFNPLTLGHINLLEKASNYGRLIVAVSNDKMSIKKSGYSFMPTYDRMKIISKIKEVDLVIENDEENMVKMIKLVQPTFYVKGGDVRPENLNTEETKICNEIGCQIIYGVGGDKVESSSNLLNKYKEYWNKMK